MLATEETSKLSIAFAGPIPYFKVLHMFDVPTTSSRPIWEHTGTEGPQLRRLRLPVHAPAHLMSAKAEVRLILCHFAEYRTEATLTCDRDVGVLTLRVIEVGFDAAVLSHADFGVCGVLSRYANQAQRNLV